MRLLCVEHKTVWGGGQVALVNLLREWQIRRAPIEPSVVCPPGAELAPRVRALHVPCETFEPGAIEKNRGLFWNLGQRALPTARFLRLMRRTRPDVTLANGAFSFLASVAAVKLARVPILWFEHNTTLPDGAVLRRMIAQANHIVAVSEAIRDQFLQLAPDAQGKITLIHNGVDVERFFVSPEARKRKRRELGIEENELVAGTVSRLSPEKGIVYFIDAAHEILRQQPGARFLIVGDGPERVELERRAGSDAIRFVGAQENVTEWLNALDVFVMPSLAEAFGLAVVEAMACGLPVVASDAGGLRDIVRERESGLRVPLGDAGAIARAVLELGQDAGKRRAFGQAGRSRVEEQFTLNRQARAMQDVLESILK